MILPNLIKKKKVMVVNLTNQNNANHYSDLPEYKEDKSDLPEYKEDKSDLLQTSEYKENTMTVSNSLHDIQNLVLQSLTDQLSYCNVFYMGGMRV